MNQEKRIFWPYTVDEWNSRFVNYSEDPLQDYRLEEWHPFEEKLKLYLPTEDLPLSSEQIFKKTESGIPPKLIQGQDAAIGKLFVERNPYDFKDETPHLALVVPYLTEGNHCKEVALIFTLMPRVTIFKDNGQIHYTGILRPKYLSPELIAEAIVKEYWVLVHEMVCLHKEIPHHGLYLGELKKEPN